MTKNTLDAFDLYLDKLHWPIVAVRSRSKQPAFAGWQTTYRPWQHRRYLEKRPEANIGLLLGRMVDVEADSEEGNSVLEALLGDYPHMRYASHKSVHHLFINPFPALTRVVLHDVEFRANNHQSLLPPSIHPNGARYKWLRPTTWQLTELPQSLRKLCKSRYAREIKSVALVSIACPVCQQGFNLPRSLVLVEQKAFKMMEQPWHCNKCRRADLRQIRRFLRRTGV